MKWQQKLLSEDAFTYDRTLKLLLAMEAAEKEARDISSIKDVHNVHHKCLSPIYNSHRNHIQNTRVASLALAVVVTTTKLTVPLSMRNVSTVIRKGIFQQCVFRGGETRSNRRNHLKINNTNTLREKKIKHQEGLRTNLLIRWRRLQNQSNRPNTRCIIVTQ